MTYEEYKTMFLTDQEGKFVSLILPPEKKTGKPQLDLRGKAFKDLSIEDVVRAKKYAAEVFEKVQF